MKFEEILKFMKAGKKARCPSLSPNIIELNVENKAFYVNDGLSILPIYGLKVEFILAEDWEIVDD